MDQVKKIFASMLMYKFWILSGFVAVVSLVVFSLNSMRLSKDTADRITAIKGKYAEVSTVSGKLSVHPNADSHRRMKAILGSLEKDVEKAWKLQYDLQLGLMTWPSKAFANEAAANIFRGLRPVEKFVPFPEEGLTGELLRVTERDRNVYRDYIGDTFPEITKKIGTEWKANVREISRTGSGGFGGYGGSSSMAMSDMAESGGLASFGGTMGGSNLQPSKDVVIWSKASQQALLSEIVPWYDPKKAPSIHEIYYTQEDIWLLTNLMEIIKRTNGNARENFQATIKEIEFIRFGKYANRDAGTLTTVTSSNASGFGGMLGSSMPGMGGDSDESGGSSDEEGYGGSMPSEGLESSMSEAFGGEMVEVDPADGRYISFATETFFQTRTGQEIRDSIKSIKPENAVDAVAKRIPIRLRVKMDPSKVHQLITECGNAPLMLEVFQVRMATAAAQTGGSRSGYGGSLGGGGYPGGGMSGGGGMEEMSGGMGMGMSGGMGMGMGMGGGIGQTRSGIDANQVIPVEIFGLIYLYNPYDRASLGEVEGTNEDEEAANQEGDTGFPSPTPVPAPATPTLGSVDSAISDLPSSDTANPADPNMQDDPGLNAEPATDEVEPVSNVTGESSPTEAANSPVEPVGDEENAGPIRAP